MQINTTKISHLQNHPSAPALIKNIIFDFGGVICNIDIRQTKIALTRLGAEHFNTADTITETRGLFEQLELGLISPQDFRAQIKPFFTQSVTDQQLDEAWNALLLDIPPQRIRLLENLRRNYRIFLLSNSNAIHYQKYLMDFTRGFGYHDFNELFEKAYFSFNIGMKKPSAEIFKYVLNHSGLIPDETLFIDDTLIHVEGAFGAGLNGHHLKINEGEEILHLFTTLNEKKLDFLSKNA